jgi:hypothetical protein
LPKYTVAFKVLVEGEEAENAQEAIMHARSTAVDRICKLLGDKELHVMGVWLHVPQKDLMHPVTNQTLYKDPHDLY